MPIEVKMAKLSPTMETGKLVKWRVKVGDTVKEGDVLAEVETDKATMDMESFDDGTVARLDVTEGEEIALGQRMLVLAKKGEDPKAVAASAPAAGAASQSPARSAAASSANGPDQAAAPRVEAQAVAPVAAAGGRARSSPLARKLAAQAGVELGEITGTGPNGRVIRADVEAHLEKRPAAGAPPRRVAAVVPSGQSRRIPHTRMRRTIADRMLQAKLSAPEIHVTVDVRMERTLAIRERLNKRLEPEKIKLSVGDFITKAVALALRAHPAVNASFEEDAIVEHGDVNIGIAVALDGGLIVPVLQQADQLGLRDIRLGTQALAVAARQNKLNPRQMMGGTFTISNLGMYGVKQFDAILNLPEVGILAVGTTEERPVVENGQIVPGHVMTLTLTADHRAVDGATAAEFMRTLKEHLEEPASMLL